MDGDEGLFASYSDVQFREPVLAGDVIEVTATVVRTGRRSRGLAFEARVVCRADPGRGPSASRVLERAGHRGHRHRDRGRAADQLISPPGRRTPISGCVASRTGSPGWPSRPQARRTAARSRR